MHSNFIATSFLVTILVPETINRVNRSSQQHPPHWAHLCKIESEIVKQTLTISDNYFGHFIRNLNVFHLFGFVSKIDVGINSSLQGQQGTISTPKSQLAYNRHHLSLFITLSCNTHRGKYLRKNLNQFCGLVGTYYRRGAPF